LFGEVGADGLDEGALTDAWHAGDANPPRRPGMRQAAVDHLGREVFVRRQFAFDEGDRPGEGRPVARQDAGDVFVNRETSPARRGGHI